MLCQTAADTANNDFQQVLFPTPVCKGLTVTFLLQLRVVGDLVRESDIGVLRVEGLAFMRSFIVRTVDNELPIKLIVISMFKTVKYVYGYNV